MNTRLIPVSTLMGLVLLPSCKAPATADPLVESALGTPSAETSDSGDAAFFDAGFSDPYFIESKAVSGLRGPTKITRNLLPATDGTLWLASWEGIFSFDGKIFTNHTNKAGLRRCRAFCAIEDRSGNLWFGTVGAGIYRYDGTRFTNFTAQDGLASDRIGCFFEDQSGTLWIGTDGGVSRCAPSPSEPGRLTFTNFTTDEGLSHNDINSIIQDQKGRLWFGTRGEACSFDGKAFSLIQRDDGSPFSNVRTIVRDVSGAIWLGGNDGLWSFDGKAFRQFSTEFTGYIYEDSKRNLWVGSTKIRSRRWTLTKISASREKSQARVMHRQDGQIFGIVEDRSGILWFGHERGITRYDGETFRSF